MVNDILFSTNNFDAEAKLTEISKKFSAKSDFSPLFLNEIKGSVSVDNQEFVFSENLINENIEWRWHIKKVDNDTLIFATLKNVSDKNIFISNINFFADITKDINSFSNPMLFVWNTWDMSVKKIENSEYSSDNILHISSNSGKTLFIGFSTLSRAWIKHKLKVENGKYFWNVKMNIGKFCLTAGETFNSELLTVSGYSNPYIALETWAENINNIYEPQVNFKPTVCYGIGCMRPNGERYEDVILENLDVINEKFNGLDVSYVWTSQNNLKDYIPGNWLLDNFNEMPEGLEKFTEKLSEKGFKHGVWMSPFWFFKESDGNFERCKDFLVKDKNGEPIINEMAWCWKYDDDDKPNYHYQKCTLDGTNPKTIEYVKELFTKYREIGIRYYMLDFLDINPDADYYNKSLTPVQSGYNILKTVRDAAGDETHLQTAVSSSPGFTGIINAARIGRDFGEGRHIDRDELNDFKNATHVFHDMHYSNLKYFLINTACNYFTHQKSYMNDMNCLMIDSFPVNYSQFTVTLFGLNSSTPLVLSGDFRDMREEKINMMKLVLPRTEYSSKPYDLFERVSDDYSRIQVVKVKNDFDEYMVVGVFNADQTPYELTLDFEKLGLSGEQIIYDFWNEEYRGVFKDSFPVTLLPESCKLFRVTPKYDYPWVIGTNMHIQQGVAEIKNISWNAEEMTLSLTLSRPKGQKGSVFISAPRNMNLINRGKCHILKELIDQRLFIELPVDFSSDEMSFKLEFEKWEFENIIPRGLMPYATMDELKEYMAKNYKREKTRVFD